MELKPESSADGGSSFTADLCYTHEEGDTRIVLHAAFYVKTGCPDVIIEANDTDIVVILLQSFSKIEAQTSATPNIWVCFKDKAVSVTELANGLPPSLVNSGAFLHCYTSSDTASYFYSKGKKTILKAAMPWLTQISAVTDQVSRDIQEAIELEDEIVKLSRDILIASYGKIENFDCLNDLRVHLFPHRKTLKSLPPTDDSFKFPVKRCIFQWSVMLQALVPSPIYFSPLDFGWELKDGKVLSKKSALAAWPSTIQKVSPYCKCKNCRQKCPCAARVIIYSDSCFK